MSLILDALRRADAERERGQLPDLHARSPRIAAVPNPSAEAVPWAKVAAALFALLLAGGAGWLWQWAAAPADAPVTASSKASSQTAPLAYSAEQTKSAPAPSDERAKHSPAPLETAVSPPVSAPSEAIAAPAPARHAERPAQFPPPRAAAAQAPETPAAPTVSLPKPTMTMDAAVGTLPPVKIGGAMYSDAPENRVLVINDQALHEGEPVQPGLVLERIGATSATLRWRGQKFDVPY